MSNAGYTVGSKNTYFEKAIYDEKNKWKHLILGFYALSTSLTIFKKNIAVGYQTNCYFYALLNCLYLEEIR